MVGLRLLRGQDPGFVHPCRCLPARTSHVNIKALYSFPLAQGVSSRVDAPLGVLFRVHTDLAVVVSLDAVHFYFDCLRESHVITSSSSFSFALVFYIDMTGDRVVSQVLIEVSSQTTVRRIATCIMRIF